MKLEEILFGLIGTGGSWTLNIKTRNGEGKVCIKNGEIINAYYKTKDSEFKGETALILIIEDADLVETIDLFPLKKNVQKSLHYDFSALMALFESRSTKANSNFVEIEIDNGADEIIEEISIKKDVKGIVDLLSDEKSSRETKDNVQQKNFTSDISELIELCEKVFSSGTVKAVMIVDKENIFKVVGNVVDLESLNINGLIVNISTLASELCKENDFIEIVANLEYKFIYCVCDVRSQKSIIAIIDSKEKGSFELDKPLIYESFLKALKTL